MMKKIFTLIIVSLAIVSGINAQKSVIYATAPRTDLEPGAWAEDNDVVIQMLKADDNFNVTVVELESGGVDPGTSAAVVLSGYDVIILHDGLSSSDAFWKSTGAAAIATLPAPTIYGKMYALQAGKAFTTSSGASSNTNALNLTVVESGSDLFKGIDVTSGTITALKGGVADKGSTGDRGLQYNTGNVVPDNTLLAYPEGATDVTISFSDFPAGSTIDDATLTNRVMVLGYNVGVARCTAYDGLTAFTVDGLTLMRNAVYSLAGLTVPDTPVDMGFIPTATFAPKISKSSVISTKGGIRVAAGSNVVLYSIAGKVVSEGVAQDGYVACPKGLYIVKVDGKASKVMVK